MARKPKDDKETSEAPAQDDAAAPASRFPLFYSAPRPLEASRHAILGQRLPILEGVVVVCCVEFAMTLLKIAVLEPVELIVRLRKAHCAGAHQACSKYKACKCTPAPESPR